MKAPWTDGVQPIRDVCLKVVGLGNHLRLVTRLREARSNIQSWCQVQETRLCPARVIGHDYGLQILVTWKRRGSDVEATPVNLRGCVCASAAIYREFRTS